MMIEIEPNIVTLQLEATLEVDSRNSRFRASVHGATIYTLGFTDRHTVSRFDERRANKPKASTIPCWSPVSPSCLQKRTIKEFVRVRGYL